MDESLGDGFQLLPAFADALGLLFIDMMIAGGPGYHGKKIGKFLHHLVGGRNEIVGVSPVLFGVLDEETTGPFAYPLHQSWILSGLEQGFDAVERIGGTTAAFCGGFGPFVDHGQGEAHVIGDLFWVALVKDLAQQFVGLHKVYC